MLKGNDTIVKNKNESWRLFYANLQFYLNTITLKHYDKGGSWYNNDWDIRIEFKGNRTALLKYVRISKGAKLKPKVYLTYQENLTESQVMEFKEFVAKHKLNTLPSSGDGGYPAPHLQILFFNGKIFKNHAQYGCLQRDSIKPPSKDEKSRYAKFIVFLLDMFVAVIPEAQSLRTELQCYYHNTRKHEYVERDDDWEDKGEKWSEWDDKEIL